MSIRKLRKFFMIIVVLTLVIIVPIKAVAAEKDNLSTDTVESAALPTEAARENISVDFPTLQENEESPFDFIIDPQNLLFETDASIYGGGVVEEGANLLFHNRMEGEYDFSRRSDNLTATNRSTVPVTVTITARITDIGNLQMTQNKEIPEDGLPYVYLALVDDEGNEQPISEDGEVSISARMERAPQNVYAYTLDPATGNYEYRLSEASEDVSFDTYSFGLTGECSSNADWGNISVHPKVVVTWHVEPILTEQETEEDEQMLEKRQSIEEMPGDVGNEEMPDEDSENDNIIKEEEINDDVFNENIPNGNTANRDVVDEAEGDKRFYFD